MVAESSSAAAPRGCVRHARCLLLLLVLPLVHPALLSTCGRGRRLSTLVPQRCGGPNSGCVRRGRRAVRACASEEEEADADLASAWLDDEKASSLQQAPGEPFVLGPAEAHALLAEGKVALLDLRTPWQFARERVPGAANVPAGEPGPSGLLFHFRKGFVEELRASHPPEAAPLLLMCELGVVSLVAANKLLDHGYAEVSVVRGGLEAWRDEPLPTEADKALPEAEQEEDYDTDEWWRSAVGPFPEWTAAEALPMWPVAGADAEPPEAELDADELGLLGLDELELDEFGELTDGAEEAPAPFGTGFAEKLFAEEPPPPSPLEAADRAAAGLDELVADLDKAIPAGSDGKPPKKGKKAKAGAPKTSLAAAAAEGGEGEEERLSLFHTEGGADPQDDFLIDEVFSAM